MQRISTRRLVCSDGPCADKLVSQAGDNVVLCADGHEIVLLVFDEDNDEWYVTGHQSVVDATGSMTPEAAFEFRGIEYVDVPINGYAQLDDNDVETWRMVYQDFAGVRNACQNCTNPHECAFNNPS